MIKEKGIEKTNKTSKRHVMRLSETHYMLYVGSDMLDITLAPKLAALCKRIKQQFPTLIEIIPSYNSIMIEFHPYQTDINELEYYLTLALIELDQLEAMQDQKLIQLPVYYHSEVAPDLQSLAQMKGLSIEELVKIHYENDYTVCAIGFAPSFAFLGALDKKIATARHAEPRLNVAKGSVGIADQQTAVYPNDSPGGWQIIGNCPINLHESPFNVGDKVRFVAIDRKKFIELGGVIPS